MWAFRRGSIHLKNQGLNSGTTRICCGKSEVARCYLKKCSVVFVESQEITFDGLLFSTRFSNKFSSSAKPLGKDSTSSQAGAHSSDSEEEDGLDTNSLSEPELSKESEADKRRLFKSRNISPMTRAIIGSREVSVENVMEKWVKEGNEVTKTEISVTLLFLQKRKMYVKALQLSKWLESSKHIEFQEYNYASLVDLIAKVRGPTHAQEYINKIPEQFRGEMVYCKVLANYVAQSNVHKSIEVFNRMKKLGFPITTFLCNQLLLLRLKTDKTKIDDILMLMQKENLQPTRFTYQTVINAKGISKDITGMEQTVETMKSQGVEPNAQIQISLASHYSNAGLKDKAKAVLKQMEGDDLKKNRWACPRLLAIYASMKMEDEVERIWSFCERHPFLNECVAAISAWGKLNKIEQAEAVFYRMIKITSKPTYKHFMPLLWVYADHKMLDKVKLIVKQMENSGCKTGPLVYDELVKVYIAAGDVEKAVSMLKNAMKDKKAMFDSYFAILESCAARGDVGNAEKVFLKIKRAGFAPRLREYRTLLEAYLNAEAPVYGFVERMKGDNLSPDTVMSQKLAKLTDKFRRTNVTDSADKSRRSDVTDLSDKLRRSDVTDLLL